MNRNLSTSTSVYFRYPAAVRAGVSSPRSSRKRTFDALTSGNSVLICSSTSPIVKSAWERLAISGVTGRGFGEADNWFRPLQQLGGLHSICRHWFKRQQSG